MVENSAKVPDIMGDNGFGGLEISWGWLLALGILSVVLGTVGLGMVGMLTIASVIFFGVLLLVGGAAQLFQAFTCKGWKSVLWHVLIALLYLAAGIVCITDPVGSSGVLTLALAWILIAVGVFRGIMAFQLRGNPGWVWVLIAGAIAIALGLMILAQWPESALWIIGLFVAIELIFNGWSEVFIALAARRAGQRGGPARAAP
jgi:uncharacterized membrane protein HdeD (DUF308 family)